MMNNGLSLKIYSRNLLNTIHIQIYTTEIYTSAAKKKKSFDLYFLEARMSSSIFEKYRKWDNKILCSVCGSKSRSILQQ